MSRSPNRELASLVVAAALVLTSQTFAPAFAAGVPPRLTLPAEGHLTHAWILDDGPSLVAWESTEAGWSKVALYDDGEKRREWVFDDFLVKDARWIVPGETMRLGVVSEHGSEERVYSIGEGGDLRLLGSTRGLRRGWDELSLAMDGTTWSAARFRADGATVAVGRLGETDPSWSRELRADELGPAKSGPGVSNLLDRTELLAADPPLLAVLWGGRLWLAEVGSTRMAEVAPPGDCSAIQSFASTAGGVWVQCLRGLEAEPPGILWGFVASRISATGQTLQTRALWSFRDPWFRRDGTVLDLDRRQGTVKVYSVGEVAREAPVHLGTLHLPPTNARWIPAGDVLLENPDRTEEYVTLPINAEVTRLRQEAAALDR